MDSPPAPLPSHILRPDGPIHVGISSCLLGEAVRWNGGHKRDAFVAGTLARYFTFVPVCPEVAIGLGVPRPPIRLVAAGNGVRATRMDEGGTGVTRRLAAYGRKAAAELDETCGYILKSDSPSCGMARVRVHRPGGGAPARRGVGIYARALMAARPDLPVEEEGRLDMEALRESFLERVVALRRWRLLEDLGMTSARLAQFHAAHRLSLMAHGSGALDALERLVSRSKQPIRKLAADYLRGFMAALGRPATRAGHGRVLARAGTQLADALGPAGREELAEAIEAYRRGRVPLGVPLWLLRRALRHRPHPALQGQTYLHPHPAELKLRLDP